jgi:peptidoglycan hydrolase CwlO-like protein
MGGRRLAALASVALLLSGCRTSEEEALEAARQEVRKEMQPEVDRRQREIDELEKQIAAAKARLAARQTSSRKP